MSSHYKAEASMSATQNIDVPFESNAPRSGEEPYDLIGIGFGPANLAIAVALHDAMEANRPLPGLTHIRGRKPRVLFLERQESFGWHEGMLIPGAKMQISFVKDFATLRDPRSHFTFLNYLHTRNRIAQFTNLDTFLPQRLEYQDYMKWCASHFTDSVRYSSEVHSIQPVTSKASSSRLAAFDVSFTDVNSGRLASLRTKHVIISAGGRPSIPRSLPQTHPRVLHSSKFLTHIDRTLPDRDAPYKIAVVGAGQSAAECFNDLHGRFPHASTRLFIRGAALKPSDDSPFVNELFDAEQVDAFNATAEEHRLAGLRSNRATNYGVVRLGLLEELYSKLYTQRIRQPDESQWQHRIINNTSVTATDAASGGLTLAMRDTRTGADKGLADVDCIVVATGYVRDIGDRMLSPCKAFLSEPTRRTGRCQVGRNYAVQFDEGRVEKDAGAWLQGCNEETHGLSDSLLSILATRGGEMVHNIFGDDVYPKRDARLSYKL